MITEQISPITTKPIVPASIMASPTMAPPNPPTRIMTVDEVAELLRLHRSTISRFAKSGDLKSYKLGNRRLFKSEDVWSFFENHLSDEVHLGGIN